MNINLKYVGYILLIISAAGLVILNFTGGNIDMIPIDQAKCPPNLGLAEDGTCGIYEGKKISAGSQLFIASGILSVVSLAVSHFQDRKNG